MDARTSAVTQRLQNLEASIAAERFFSKHPDHQAYVGNPDFQAWLQASAIRQRAAAEAVKGDLVLADELLSEYKALKPAKPAEKPAGEQGKSGLEAARAASLESGAQGSGSGDGTKGKKIYRRVDLLELKARKPDAYYSDDFQHEIMLAYQEGRVK